MLVLYTIPNTRQLKFTRTGNFEGDAELFINGKSVDKTHIDKTVSVTYSIEETFDMGEDTGSFYLVSSEGTD